MQNLGSASLPQKEVRLSIGKAAKYLGVSVDTLRRWEKKGVVSPHRSPGGHRYFIKEDLEDLFNQKHSRQKPQKTPAPSPATPSPIQDRVDKPSSAPSSFGTPLPLETKAVISPVIDKNSLGTQRPKSSSKSFSVKKIFVVALVFFAIMDIVLLLFYFSMTRSLASPIP